MSKLHTHHELLIAVTSMTSSKSCRIYCPCSPHPVRKFALQVVSKILPGVSRIVFSAIRVYALSPSNKALCILTFILLFVPPFALAVRTMSYLGYVDPDLHRPNRSSMPLRRCQYNRAHSTAPLLETLSLSSYRRGRIFFTPYGAY